MQQDSPAPGQVTTPNRRQLPTGPAGPAVNGSDPCAQATTPPVAYATAAACLNSVPLTDPIKLATIDNLRKIFQLYPTLDIVKDSPEPNRFPSKLDLLGELDKLAAQQWPNYREFMDAISKLVVGLQDGHVMFAAKCSTLFAFVQPWSLEADYTTLRDGGKPLIKLFNQSLASVPPALFRQISLQALKIDFSKFLGYEVVSIDGQPAVDFLTRVADIGVGSYRDSNTRFNSLLPSQVWNGKTNTFMFAEAGTNSFPVSQYLPTSPSVAYKLRGPDGAEVDLNLEWVAIPIWQGNTIRDTATFTSTCLNNTQSSNVLGNFFENSNAETNIPTIPPLPTIPPDTSSDPIKLDPKLYGSAELPPAPGFDIRRPVVAWSGGAFWDLGDGVTGVWVVAPLIPTDPRVDPGVWIQEWVQRAGEGLAELRKRNLRRLIVDVTGNGGGVLCLAQVIMRVLFPEIIMPEHDMRLSPLLQTLIRVTAADEAAASTTP
ncbi:hypothetical protein HK102_009482, partial [Quaeritorhiza haematococci]